MVQKACKNCKAIFDSGSNCPKCGSDNIIEGYKGKIVVFNVDESEIAKNLKIKEKGNFAVKV